MNKITKLSVMILTIALIVCAAVGISASADAEGPAIISQNVEYGGNYALMYAVAADSVSETVTLEVYNNAECTGDALWSKTIEATDANKETVQGIECYVFTTCGIAAKDMDVQYYVKVSSATGETVKRYSVAEYFYERLYKNGIASSTDAGDVKRAELYNTALLYGKQAQDVLFNLNNKTEDDRTTFVTDMKYVYVANGVGTVDGTYASGIFLNGSNVTLEVDGAIECWELYDATTGNLIKSINAGESFAVNTHVKAVAVATYRGTGKYANYVNTLDYTNATIEALTASKDVTLSTKRPLGSTKKLSFTDGALVLTSTGSSWGSVDFWGHDIGASFVLDTDLFIDGATIDKNRASYFVGQNSSQTGSADGTVYGYKLMIYSNPDTEVGGYMLEIGGSEVGVAIPGGKWINVRLEAQSVTAGSTLKLYVNGALASEFAATQSFSNIAGLQFCHASTSGGNGFSTGVMKLDNTYVGSIPYAGERGTGAYAEYAINYDTPYSDLTANGTITAVKKGATVTSVSPANDGALKIDYKANSTWGRYSIAEAGEPTEGYVFETDICFNNISIPAGRSFYAYGTANLAADAESKYNVFGFALVKNDDGSYYIRLNPTKTVAYTITEGEWINVRVEADALSNSTVRLYVNGVLVDSYNFSSDISAMEGVQFMFSSTYNGTEGFTGNILIDNTYVGAKK